MIPNVASLLADNYNAYMDLLAHCGCGPKTKVYWVDVFEL